MTAGYLTTSDRHWGRVAAADRLIVLIGSFDGSGNVGDMLQTTAALERVRTAAPDAVIAVVVESRYAMAERWVDMLPSDIVVLQFHDSAPSGGLVDFLPEMTLLYLTGGGYVNNEWGDRKLDHVDTINSLVIAGGAESLSHIMTSGLQLSDYHNLSAWMPWFKASRPLIVRDQQSATLISEKGVSEPDVFVGIDDALGGLEALRVSVDDSRCLNLHLNVEGYSTSAAGKRVAKTAEMLARLSNSVEGLRCRYLIAFDDARIREREAASELVDAFASHVADGRAPSVDFEMISLPDRIISESRTELGALGTITCSYHVGLISLMHSIPTLLLVDNRYYDQKMTVLAEMFDLGESAIIRGGDRPDVAAQLEHVRDRLSANVRTFGPLFRAQTLATDYAIGRSVARFERDVTWAQLQSVYPTYRSAVEESAELHRRVRLLSQWLTDANSRTP
jgi:hypothetical protein